MKKTRFFAALTAAAMTLSLAILPASAEETATEITIKGTQFSNTASGDGMAINKYQDTRPMSVMFNVAEEGYYNFKFRASDGSKVWLSSYDVDLNGSGKFEKKTKDGTGNVVVFDYGTVYLNKGFNELTYTLTGLRDTGTVKNYLIYLDYAKFTKLSDDYRYTSSKNGVSDFGLISSGSDDIGYENGKGKKISGKIYAPKNGTYAINYIGSIYDGQYTAPYSIYLDDEKLLDAKAGEWYDHVKQMKNFSTYAYMDAGEHEFSFVLEGDKVFYLKNMTVSDAKYSIALEGGVEGTAFKGAQVNLGSKFDYYQKNESGSVTATVSADVAGWYKMQYEATPGNGSNAYVSKYSISLNDAEIAVPAPDTTTDNLMAVHSVNENVWLNKGDNELIFNINTVGSERVDGLYIFYIRSTSFELVNETVENNKDLSVLYTEFSGDGVQKGEEDGYPIAYVTGGTPKAMTAAFNAEEAGVYSLKLIATSGASGEKTKKDWHSNYNVFVNGVLINNFARYANVLKPSGTVAAQLEGHRAENVYLKAGLNTIEIIPTETSSNNVYLVYLNSANFAKSQSPKNSAIYLAEKTDSGVKVAYINVKETGKLIAASYDESGKLTDVKIADALSSMTETTETILPLAAAEGDKVKVMLWGDIGNQAPSTEAFPIK